jgi:uncharacterized protein YjbJ (UPF0337 family)
MSESRRARLDELKARIGEAIGNAEGDIEISAVMARIRESAAKAGSEVDTDALMAHVKDAVGKAEGRVDVEKVRQAVDRIDIERFTGWLGGARHRAADVGAALAARGERLGEETPGALDKLLGTAKETLGGLVGSEELTHSGELDQLKGEIKERYADDVAEPGAAEKTRGGKPKDKGAKRG